MKLNKKNTAIISGVVIVFILCLVFALNNSKNITSDNTNSECENCVVESAHNNISNQTTKPNKFNITYSGKTVTYNAYDFIIEKMGQAQYWSYEEYEPIYNTVANHYEPSQDHVILNGTGFTLIDEESATFARGYEGRLIISFGDNKAESNGDFYKPDYDNSGFSLTNNPWTEGTTTYDTYYDFREQRCWDGYGDDIKVHAEYELLIEPYNEIRSTITFYDDVFTELGIPLLDEPYGTLTSYKNKTIEVPVELIELKYTDRWGDDLIHSPFDERVGWSWNWEDNQDNVWLDDYRDIFDQQFPTVTENEMREVIYGPTGEITHEAYYAPLFLVFDVTTWSNSYLETGGLTWTEFLNYGGAFATYYMRPLYEHIFGFNGVYLFDESSLPTGSYYGLSTYTKDQFLDSITLSVNDLNEVLYVYNEGDWDLGQEHQCNVLTQGSALVRNYFDELCEHYNVKSIYGKDYVDNLTMIYSVTKQRVLGLR